ncbi:MAG: cytidylate kinase family protein [Dehalococcoidia bacterium]
MAIITISRGTFSGGKQLAECISDHLGYRCISREDMLGQACREFSIPQEKLDIALMHKPGFLERMSLRRIHYLAYIRASLIKQVKDENIVYHGQAGHLLLHNVPNVLRVRVIADWEYRIEAAMERNNLDRENAIKFIKEADEERNKWVKSIYGVDRNDPSGYDLVINLEHIIIDNACEVVSTLATRDEFKKTLDSQKKIEDLILATDIRARIALSRNITDSDIDVTADNGLVTITGNVDRIDDADRIRALVRQIPGVKDVDSQIKVSQFG